MLRQLLGDGEIDIAIAFNPADASAAIGRGELPSSVRTYIHDIGTLANVHFLAKMTMCFLRCRWVSPSSSELTITEDTSLPIAAASSSS